MSATIAFLMFGCSAAVAAAVPERADLIVTHAKIATVDEHDSVVEAMAVRDGRIIAVGSDAAIRRLAAPRTRIIDAGGRTVIPGLIDSHIHAIRAGLSFTTEVNWIDLGSIPAAMARLRDQAARLPQSGWLIVAGGWTDQQFAERRRPTRAEIEAAAGGHPAYFMLGYSAVMMNDAARRELGLAPGAAPPGMRAEVDAAGNPTGWFSSSMDATVAYFERLPKPDDVQKIAGTRTFFSELNRLAITGLIDPGGVNLPPAQYAAVRYLWRQRELTLRVRYTVSAQHDGDEAADFRDAFDGKFSSEGDDMYRFLGIGERITGAMYSPAKATAEDRAKFEAILTEAAARKLEVTVHCLDGASAPILLDIFERIDARTPLRALRWSIAHLDDAAPETFVRMAKLGVGWTMQDFLYYSGDRRIARDPAAAAHMPPIMTAYRAGVTIGAGTDAHRVSSYNPFINLRWMLDGRTIGGHLTRDASELPSRALALRFYTSGSAWFSGEETRRGGLSPGKAADFAMLDRDYFTVPLSEMAATTSLLTVVGGKIVYAAKAFASGNAGVGRKPR